MAARAAKSKTAKYRGTITVTIGDRAENHAGMEILGAEAEEGFTCKELRAIGRLLEKRGVEYEILDLRFLGLSSRANKEHYNNAEEASLLIIRNGLDELTKSTDVEDGGDKHGKGDEIERERPENEVSELDSRSEIPDKGNEMSEIPSESKEVSKGDEVSEDESLDFDFLDLSEEDEVSVSSQSDLADGMWAELIDQDHDRQYYDRRRKKVLNKQARWNLCITHTPQEPNYEEGQGRVLAFCDLPHLDRLRCFLPKFLGKKARNMVAETNYYYDLKKCGIGFHGDTERKIVIGVRLGQSMNLVYQWYQHSTKIGRRIEVMLHHGDMYVMSEKAVGTDWRRKVIPTLRHAAGKHAEK